MPDTQAHNVSRETSARLHLFEVLLVKWNQRINLVGPREISRLWTRHIPESLLLAALVPEGSAVIDLGSGAGFPGLMIAIACNTRVTLIESDNRKGAFLRECGRELQLAISVITERAEIYTGSLADVVTARAFAPLARLLAIAHPLLRPTGRCLLLKGARVDAELTEAQRKWQMTVVRHPGLATGDGCILEVSHLQRINQPVG